jgi:hypothetical protein
MADGVDVAPHLSLGPNDDLTSDDCATKHPINRDLRRVNIANRRRTRFDDDGLLTDDLAGMVAADYMGLPAASQK